jgi:hypothetical protein
VVEDFLVEGIKFIGGLAGLGTAGFTIYDRLVKGRPIVNISAKKRLPGVATEFRLTIRNPTDRDIIIRDIHLNRPEVIVGSDETVTSLLMASDGVRYRAIVPANSERWFRLYDRSDDPADLPVSIEIFWRPVTASRFERQPVSLRISTGLLRDLREEAERRLEAAEEIRKSEF